MPQCCQTTGFPIPVKSFAEQKTRLVAFVFLGFVTIWVVAINHGNKVIKAFRWEKISFADTLYTTTDYSR